MSVSIKPFIIRSVYRHKTYAVELHSDPYSIYVMPYASPMSAYVAAMQHYANRKIIKNEHKPTHFKAPPVSDLAEIMAQLTNELENPENNDRISDLVNSEFIFGKAGASYKKVHVARDNYDEYQSTSETYQNYEVRPMIEMLMLHKAQEIKALLATTSETKRQQFLAALSKLQLAHNEAINFSGFDLRDVSFAGASLGQSRFDDADITNADFTDCDLADTNLSQEQLDTAATYKNAKLRDGTWLYWDASIKSALLTRIEAMENHAAAKIPKEHPKHAKVQELCGKYKPLLTGNDPISGAKKLEMFNAFNSKETTDLLEGYRDLKSRAAEICTAIAGLMTGAGLIVYLVALGIQRYRNGYWGLFAKPQTAALAHDVFHHTPTRADA